MTIEGVTDVLKKLEKNRKQCFFLQYVCTIFWDVTWNWCMENWKHASGDRVRTLLYGSDHAEAWTDTRSEAEKSDL